MDAAVADCVGSSAGGRRTRHRLAFSGLPSTLHLGQSRCRSAGGPIVVGGPVLRVPVGNASIRHRSDTFLNVVGMVGTNCELAVADTGCRTPNASCHGYLDGRMRRLRVLGRLLRLVVITNVEFDVDRIGVFRGLRL